MTDGYGNMCPHSLYAPEIYLICIFRMAFVSGEWFLGAGKVCIGRLCLWERVKQECKRQSQNQQQFLTSDYSIYFQC